MVKALGALPGEPREIDLKPWLYRIAHNESIDLIAPRPARLAEEDRLPPGATLAEEVETRQRLRQLIADVGELPERQRGALLMREAGGLGFAENGTALGTSPAVARQTLYEARLGLREMEAGRNMECTAVTKALSDGDRGGRRRRDIGAHLKGWPACRHLAEGIDSRATPWPRSAAPGGRGGRPPAGARRWRRGRGRHRGAGSGAAGATGASSAGGIGGAVGAGAGKAIGTATLLKGAATIAAAAAIGVGGADVAGVIHHSPHADGPRGRTPGSKLRPARPPPGPRTPGPSSVGGDR